MTKIQEPIKNRIPYTIPDRKDWPIARLSSDKKSFLKEVIEIAGALPLLRKT